MDRRPLETAFARFSIASAVVHFVLESLYHLKFGQFLPMLIVDYIADTLLLYGAWVSLRQRPGGGAGLLCGAWGFTFCLAYRSFFWRLEDFLAGGTARGAEPDALLCVLAGALLLAASAFLVSAYLAHPLPVKG